MRVRFLGSGDAFGSGGRFQTCILVEGAEGRLLLDCGASSLIAMRRFGVDPDGIDAILLTHLHGDHFGGVPFFLLEARVRGERRRPLRVAGPPGTRRRLAGTFEALYPGAMEHPTAFPVDIEEMVPGPTYAFGPAEVQAFPAHHLAGDPAYSLRLRAFGRTLAFTGDTGWHDALPALARKADLFITECTGFDEPYPYHLNYCTLQERMGEFSAGRVVITHLGPTLLNRLAAGALEGEFAQDGLTIWL